MKISISLLIIIASGVIGFISQAEGWIEAPAVFWGIGGITGFIVGINTE